MNEEKKKAYSEVVEILKLMDEEKLEKLPVEVAELIKGNSDPTYTPHISKDIPIEEQNLKEETYVILGWLANKYWGEEIIEIEEAKEEVEAEINVYNDIEPETICKEENEEISELPMIITEEKWYQRVKVKIIKFLKTIFRINEKESKEGVNE